MLRPHTRPTNLIHGIDVTSFSFAMAGVALTILTIFMTFPTTTCRGLTTDLPKVNHPTSMAKADREDALILGIMRDGKVFLGRDQIAPDQVASKIRATLPDTRERKVYIKADARAQYGSVKEALDGIRDAGIENVAFLTDQKRSPKP